MPRKTRGHITIAAKNAGHYNLHATAYSYKVAPIWIEKKFYGIPLSKQRSARRKIQNGKEKIINQETE